MTPLARILGGVGVLYVAAILLLVGHTIFAIQAIQGDELSTYMVIVLLYGWTALALVNAAGRRRNLRDWERALDNTNELHQLAGNYASLLGEACSALSTWDREQSDDIVERAITINRLHQQNIDERNPE